MGIKVMSNQGNKTIYCVMFICFLIFSCTKYQKYNPHEIQEIRSNDITSSQSIIGEEKYWELYNMLNDTVNDWIKNQIDYYKYFDKQREWLLDSILCVNKEGNKLITSILKRSMSNESEGDFIDHFYGAKIRDQWYFFGGPTLVLPREYYQKDIHTPLSFEKLKEIATAHIYRGYLKKGKKGQWEINENFFRDIIPQDRTKEIYGLKSDEEYVKYVVGLNWTSRDTTNTE
jgi:hypothetical protein